MEIFIGLLVAFGLGIVVRSEAARYEKRAEYMKGIEMGIHMTQHALGHCAFDELRANAGLDLPGSTCDEANIQLHELGVWPT